MKFGATEICEMTDWALTAAHHNCGQVIKQRENASKHSKFNDDKKKLEFPPINPKFTEIKNEIENEMKKRKLL